MIGLQSIDGITNAFKIPRLKRGWVLKELGNELNWSLE